jgi:hypothetical protein
MGCGRRLKDDKDRNSIGDGFFFLYIIMSLLETFFIDPKCHDQPYEESDEEKWVVCSQARGLINSVMGTLVVIAIVIVCLIALEPTGKIVAGVIGACAIAGIWATWCFLGPRTARWRFQNSRAELAGAGYSEGDYAPGGKFATATPAEKEKARKEAVAQLRTENSSREMASAFRGGPSGRFGNQTGFGRNRVYYSGPGTGLAQGNVGANIGAVLGDFLSNRLR